MVIFHSYVSLPEGKSNLRIVKSWEARRGKGEGPERERPHLRCALCWWFSHLETIHPRKSPMGISVELLPKPWSFQVTGNDWNIRTSLLLSRESSWTFVNLSPWKS